MARRKRGTGARGAAASTRKTRSAVPPTKSSQITPPETVVPSPSESEESSSSVSTVSTQQIITASHKKFGKFRCLHIDENVKQEISGSDSEVAFEAVSVAEPISVISEPEVIVEKKEIVIEAPKVQVVATPPIVKKATRVSRRLKGASPVKVVKPEKVKPMIIEESVPEAVTQCDIIEESLRKVTFFESPKEVEPIIEEVKEIVIEQPIENPSPIENIVADTIPLDIKPEEVVEIKPAVMLIDTPVEMSVDYHETIETKFVPDNLVEQAIDLMFIDEEEPVEETIMEYQIREVPVIVEKAIPEPPMEDPTDLEAKVAAIEIESPNSEINLSSNETTNDSVNSGESTSNKVASNGSGGTENSESSTENVRRSSRIKTISELKVKTKVAKGRGLVQVKTIQRQNSNEFSPMNQTSPPVKVYSKVIIFHIHF